MLYWWHLDYKILNNPTNLSASGHATTSSNINNPPRSKVKWRKRGRSNDVLAKGMNAQVKKKT